MDNSAFDIPKYETTTIALSANGTYTLNADFTTLAILDLSGAAKMTLNDKSESDCDAGIQLAAPPGGRFFSVTFRETAGAAATIRVALSFGAVRDSRFTASGNLNIQNAAAPNDELQVKTKAGTSLLANLAAADAGLVALAASIKGSDTLTTLIAALREDQQLRAPLTTLAGATHAGNITIGSEQTIVASGTNTSGIILRTVSIACSANFKNAYVGINDGASKPIIGIQPSTAGNTEGNPGFTFAKNIFIPAGVALVAYRTDSKATINLWYEVL